MKYFLSVLLAFIACGTLVYAQETETLGLSAGYCEWIHVKEVLGENGIAWKECAEGTDKGCVYKFCNGPSTDGEWKKEMCNRYCISLQEELPLGGKNIRSISGDSGIDLLGNYFGLWYKMGALILGLIGVLVIVVSGVQIIFGGVSEEMISGAKTRIWAAILSLILLFSSALILKTINPLFFS